MEVRRILLVPHPAERMYDLIEGAEHYPAFLPWCGAATILVRSDEEVAARVTVEVRGVRFQFVTRNRKRRPTWMGLGLEEGPFRRFEGEWNLVPLGDAGCRIDFALRYDFENAVMRRVAGAVFERITNTLVDAFVARADALGERIPTPLPVPPAPTMRPAGPGAPARSDATAIPAAPGATLEAKATAPQPTPSDATAVAPATAGTPSADSHPPSPDNPGANP